MNDGLSVARRAGAGRMVIGDVMKVGSRTTVIATLFNVRDGKQIRTTREETTVADSIIPLFAKIARRILAVPSGDANTGTIGTTRVDAYKSYVAGNQALNRFDAVTAKQQYEAALALDTNFALAHYKWAIAAMYDTKAGAARQAQVKVTELNNMARTMEDPQRIAHAKSAARLSSTLPPRERALIAGLLATVSYDYPRACESYRSLVRADSSDVEALYGYGYCLLADDMVMPVTPGDTSRMRFRTSWNESLDMFRQAVSIDPTFHLAFDAIVGMLTSPVRPGCARKDVIETCADTAIRVRYVASVQRDGDSLQTTPRGGFKSLLDIIVASSRSSPPRANIELASRAAADWVALDPSEGRPHRHLALLLMRLGRTAEAERELTEALRDPVMRDDMELFLRRLEVAVKLMRGADVNRIIDSIPMVVPSELGRAAQAGFAVLSGRMHPTDSLYDAVLGGSSAPPVVKALLKQSVRVTAGVQTDTIGAMEKAFFGLRNIPQLCNASPCFGLLGPGYTLALRAPRTSWPQFAPDVAADPRLGPAIALSASDTAALRRAAVRLDSISSVRAATLRAEDASSIIAADAFLLLGDSASALRMARRMTDTTLQTTGIDQLLGIGGTQSSALWPRAILLRADLEATAKGGSKETARDLYTKFLALWAKSDLEFAPLMTRVRASLAGLK